ncbi:MAG: heparinase II/III family protein [Flavihumibacter sp.]
MKLFGAITGLLLLAPAFMSAQDLEPLHYSENFERRMLGAWASYPHWQDIAYDQNFRVNEIVPGDKNISMVQKVTPYTAVDNYAGAQKLLEAVLTPQSKLRFRYYLKTNQAVESLTVRWAADSLGKLDLVINRPETNQWKWVDLDFAHFLALRPELAGREQVPVHALAFLAKVPSADPAMPIYFSLDDISLDAMQPARFRFELPSVTRLPEFPAFIATSPYHPGATLQWKARWPGEADQVQSEISEYAGDAVLQRVNWKRAGDSWTANIARLQLPVGIYRARTYARTGNRVQGTTDLVFRVAPEQYGGHPRLLFDEKGRAQMIEKFQTGEYRSLLDGFVQQARTERSKIPVNSLVFDLDQFPDEDWLPTWSSWGNRIYHTGEALRMNARAYAFAGDKEAGEYVRAVLVRLSTWPNWTHPWQTKRGRFSEHRTGSWAHRVAEAYDLVYALIPENERKQIRQALIKNIIGGAHLTYVVDDNITGATSNWLAMTLGGSLMNLAAIAGDGPDTDNLETEIVGAVFKLDKMLNRVVDSVDGAWGEGFGYNNYSMTNLAYSLPSMQRVFGVDLSAPIRNSFNEFIWGGLVRKKEWFEYGDSDGKMGPANHWAYLLQRYRDPRLAWYYDHLRKDGAVYYEDVLYDLKNIPRKDPFGENPVKAFRQVGTTVFKSGWDSTDMVFVMRTGPFYNHQHLDQGSFWFADKGEVFVEERHLHNSNYYDDPIYQSHLIQPIGHSTILVDSNAQSQRTGDHRSFAKGFSDYAYIASFVDGPGAAFSSGDIGRLYWGKLKSLRRNVLYLKPRAVLMIDVAVPDEKDASVELLYQTAKLSSIEAGNKQSMIKKDKATLYIQHLQPAAVQVTAHETPHYLKTLNSPVPLEKEGLLQIEAVTKGAPLVMTNLLSTEAPGSTTVENGAEAVTGQSGDTRFMVSNTPGKMITVAGFQTDALCAAWTGQSLLLGQVKNYKGDSFSFTCDQELSIETDGKTRITYSTEKPAVLQWQPQKGKARRLALEAGEHVITLK